MKKVGTIQLSSVKKQKWKNFQWFPVSLKTKSKFLAEVDKAPPCASTPALAHTLCSMGILCSSDLEGPLPEKRLLRDLLKLLLTGTFSSQSPTDLPPAPHHLIYCLHWTRHYLNIFIICYINWAGSLLSLLWNHSFLWAGTLSLLPPGGHTVNAQ